MKGIILAGGLGTRLRPLTHVINKHLLPIYDQPMIHYPLQCLRNAGIDRILIVTGGAHADDFRQLLGDGGNHGVAELQYACQQGNGGIADALSLAEPFCAGEKMCVILGDNLIEKNIRAAASRFADQPVGARLLLKQVSDPRRFGVARFEGDRLVEIIEKPDVPPSDWAVTGFYFYPPDVFDIGRSLRPSHRGELEITDVNNAYLQRGQCQWEALDGWWADAGTFESLHQAACLVQRGGANHLDL